MTSLTPNPYDRACGKALARLRQHAGLTQSTVERRLGVTPLSVTARERGERLHLHVLAAICAEYGTGLLPLLIHLDTPDSTALPAAIGGEDEARIVAALTAWSQSWEPENHARDAYRARLGNLLRDLRTAPRWTVVDRTDFGLSTLVAVEHGKRPASIALLSHLADHYGLELLPLLAHAADPDGWPLDRPIGGADAPRIRAALLTWQTRPPDYPPPPPLALSPRPRAPLPPPGTVRYREGLALLLQHLRIAADLTQPDVMPHRPSAITRAESPSGPRPKLATLATLGDACRVPLLSILGRVIDPDADQRGPLGGRAASTITKALLLWESTTGSRPTDATPQGRLMDMLGHTLYVLRCHHELTTTDPRIPSTDNELRRVERGCRVTWPMLATLCDLYCVNPLAVLTYAAAPLAWAPAKSLIACGRTAILDPADPQRHARIEVPGAATILAALDGWAG